MPGESWSTNGNSATYTGKLGTAVTALGRAASLLDVEETELATRGSNHTSVVGGSIPAIVGALVSKTYQWTMLPRKPTLDGVELRNRGYGSEIDGNRILTRYDGGR